MEKVKEIFDKWSINYDKYLDTSPFYKELIAELVENASLKSGVNVLDIGVGTGRISKMVLDRVDCKIVGIDLSAEMLDVARKNLKKYESQCRFYKKDVRKIDFGNHKFDAAFAAFALHHIPDDEKLNCLRKIHQVLRPAGTLNIAEVVIDIEGNVGSPERLRHILERWGTAALLAMKHGGPENVLVELDAIKNIYLRNGEYLIPASKWQHLMQKAGFQNIQVKKVNPKLGHYIFRGESGLKTK